MAEGEEIEALIVGSEGVVDTAFVVEFERPWVVALRSARAKFRAYLGGTDG